MNEWLPLISHYGLIVVFLGAIFEGETILVLAGVLAHQGILAFPWSSVWAPVVQSLVTKPGFFLGIFMANDY